MEWREKEKNNPIQSSIKVVYKLPSRSNKRDIQKAQEQNMKNLCPAKARPSVFGTAKNDNQKTKNGTANLVAKLTC